MIEIREALRASGLRATPQRMVAARMLFAGPRHVSPQDVLTEIRGEFPSISQNTVYKILTQFEQAGLLRRLQLGGRMLFDSNPARHDHALCTSCGVLVDLPAIRSACPPGELADWDIRDEQRVWAGRCPDCV